MSPPQLNIFTENALPIFIMLEIFQYDFMIRAFIAGLCIGAIAPLIGLFLVVRRYSLLADTLAHVSLFGVAGAIFFAIPPIIGALISSIVAALGIEWLRKSKKVEGESILALFLSGSLAGALIILGLAGGLNANIFAYLFGSITTVSRVDLYIIGACAIAVIAVIFLLFKQFFLLSYDQDLATINGLPVKMLNAVLMILAAITIAISMRIVGVLLIGALMVIPVLSAIQFGVGFSRTLLLGVVLSLFSVISGLFLSFYLNVPSGAAIVLIALLLFALSLAANKLHIV